MKKKKLACVKKNTLNKNLNCTTYSVMFSASFFFIGFWWGATNLLARIWLCGTSSNGSRLSQNWIWESTPDEWTELKPTGKLKYGSVTSFPFRKKFWVFCGGIRRVRPPQWPLWKLPFLWYNVFCCFCLRNVDETIQEIYVHAKYCWIK